MTTQLNIRPRKLLLGKTVPNYVPIKIYQLFAPDKNDCCELDRINMKPPYQRPYEWTYLTSCKLINTVMTNGIIPGLINYEYQDDDIRIDDFRCENIDGQHRLKTIYAYRNGKYIELENKKKFVPSWIYIEEDNPNEKEYVFYSETDDVKEWCESKQIIPKYMTKKEQDHFDNYALEIRTICDPLTIRQRRALFSSLQNGAQVKNSNFLKNIVSNPFIDYLSKYNFEEKMKFILNKHCTKCSLNYWVQWITRLYLIFVEKNKKEYSMETISRLFTKKDSEYKNMIETVEKLDMRFDISEKEKILFYENFNRFYNFIIQFYFKFNPTKLFSLFAHLANADENREEILFSNMRFWNNEHGKRDGKIAKKMWEVTAETDERKQYFIECIEQLDKYTEPANETKKITIKPKLKQKVWFNNFSSDKNGNCPCGVSITIDDCEFGHIKAWARGGETIEKNLKPVCKHCNRQMGIRHMDDYFNEKMIF